MAEVNVELEEHHDVVLGLRSSVAAVEGRIVADDGEPVKGAEVTLMADLAVFKTVADANGVVRFQNVPEGALLVFVRPDADVSWCFDALQSSSGVLTTPMWTLGSGSIRGRIVKGTEKTPVAYARISAEGPLRGFTQSDGEGRFSLTYALPGQYALHVDRESAAGSGVSPVLVTVPTDMVVIELVDCGRIMVRFRVSDRALLREAEFELRAMSGEEASLREVSSGHGDLVATNVLPGSYVIEVALAGRTQEYAAEVRSGVTTVVEVAAP